MHLSTSRNQPPDRARRAARTGRLPGARRGRAPCGRWRRADRRARRRWCRRCNRAEIVVACDDAAATHGRPDAVLRRLQSRAVGRRGAAPLSTSSISTRRGICSASPPALDSLVVGEPQILGQVKDAHAVASETQTVGPVLNRLFHSSFAVGKRVRTETALGSGAVSVSFAAVSLARKIFGDLERQKRRRHRRRRDGKLTALHMKSQGVEQVTIISRTMAHARADGGGDRRRQRRAVGRHGHRSWARATSSSPPPARPRRF